MDSVISFMPSPYTLLIVEEVHVLPEAWDVVSSVKRYIRWDHSDSGELRQATLLARVVLLSG